MDLFRWLEILKVKYSLIIGFVYLLSYYKEFRNLFYHRIGFCKYFLNIICPEISSLVIHTKSIGEGLFIQHGFSTAIGAKSIGRNCFINQQVTIGYNNEDCPIIGNNVTIRPGAIIFGKIEIGDNVVIGAGAVVFKNVPDNATVYPSSSRIMQWKKSKWN